MTENDKYRNEHYPHFKPCDECIYWRGTGGWKGTASIYPCCHYNIDNGKLRGCEPDLINGTCECFEAEKKQKKKRIW